MVPTNPMATPPSRSSRRNRCAFAPVVASLMAVLYLYSDGLSLRDVPPHRPVQPLGFAALSPDKNNLAKPYLEISNVANARKFMASKKGSVPAQQLIPAFLELTSTYRKPTIAEVRIILSETEMSWNAETFESGLQSTNAIMHCFQLIDKNGDGFINADEWAKSEAVWSKHYDGMGNPQKVFSGIKGDAKQVYGAIDAGGDGNGYISFIEYLLSATAGGKVRIPVSGSAQAGVR